MLERFTFPRSIQAYLVPGVSGIGPPGISMWFIPATTVTGNGVTRFVVKGDCLIVKVVAVGGVRLPRSTSKATMLFAVGVKLCPCAQILSKGLVIIVCCWSTTP